jgi:hypothetical protein
MLGKQKKSSSLASLSFFTVKSRRRLFTLLSVVLVRWRERRERRAGAARHQDPDMVDGRTRLMTYDYGPATRTKPNPPTTRGSQVCSPNLQAKRLPPLLATTVDERQTNQQ